MAGPVVSEKSMWNDTIEKLDAKSTTIVGFCVKKRIEPALSPTLPAVSLRLKSPGMSHNYEMMLFSIM